MIKVQDGKSQGRLQKSKAGAGKRGGAQKTLAEIAGALGAGPGATVVAKGRMAGGSTAARLEAARAAVAAMPVEEIRFLMKIPGAMAERLEAERQRRGLRSRVATILAVLDGGMK